MIYKTFGFILAVGVVIKTCHFRSGFIWLKPGLKKKPKSEVFFSFGEADLDLKNKFSKLTFSKKNLRLKPSYSHP